MPATPASERALHGVSQPPHIVSLQLKTRLGCRPLGAHSLWVLHAEAVLFLCGTFRRQPFAHRRRDDRSECFRHLKRKDNPIEMTMGQTLVPIGRNMSRRRAAASPTAVSSFSFLESVKSHRRDTLLDVWDFTASVIPPCTHFCIHLSQKDYYATIRCGRARGSDPRTTATPVSRIFNRPDFSDNVHQAFAT